MEKEKINTIIVDDSVAFIEGLKFQLTIIGGFDIIDICYNGQELVESPYLYQAELIITDIEMPFLNGIEAAKRVNYNYPKLPLIALTMHQESVFLMDIIEAGFKAFLYKPEVPKRLSEVIRMVLSDQFVFPENLKIK